MGIHYKFDPATKQYTKRDKPVSISGDYVDLKSAVGNVARGLGKGALATGAGLGALLKQNF